MLKHNRSASRCWWALPLVLLTLGCQAVRGQGQTAPEKDVLYGEVGGQKLLLDVLYPPQPAVQPAAARPAVILVHGGGWSGGDKRDFQDMAGGLSTQGYVCFNVNYRLVTKTTNQFPAALDDVQRAVRWVRANAVRYNIDPNRVGALGASAGGHLVALLGTMETRDNSDAALAAFSSRVNCVVDLFGPTDLTAMRQNQPESAAKSLVLDFMGKAPAEAPELYRMASPLLHIDKKSVPFLIFHGTVDPLVPLDQSQRFHDALRKAEIESTLTIFEGEGHGFKQPENRGKFITQTLAFLKRHLQP